MNALTESIDRSELRYQFDAEVGERVTVLRKRAGLTQKTLAAALNVTEGTMSDKIASGPWYGWELNTVAKMVGSTLDILCGEDDIPPAPVSSISGRRRKPKLKTKDYGSHGSDLKYLDDYRGDRPVSAAEQEAVITPLVVGN